MREKHRSEIFLCSSCGRRFARGEHMMNHERRCRQDIERKSKSNPEISCQYCEQKFRTNFSARRHENRFHKVGGSAGYLLKDFAHKNKVIQDHICKVCTPPIKFSRKQCLKIHMERKHNNRQDQVKIGSLIRNLSDEEVCSQASKTVECQMCKAQFSCEQDLNKHRRSDHNVAKTFQCDWCAKRFDNCRKKRKHIHRVHRLPTHKCTECGKMFKLSDHLKQHMKTHEEKNVQKRKEIGMLKKSQLYKRAKEEADAIRNRLTEVPKTAQEII